MMRWLGSFVVVAALIFAGLSTIGCTSSPSTGKAPPSGKMDDKMGGKMDDKMGGKMDDKMGGKLSGKMEDKMGGKMEDKK